MEFFMHNGNVCLSNCICIVKSLAVCMSEKIIFMFETIHESGSSQYSACYTMYSASKTTKKTQTKRTKENK